MVIINGKKSNATHFAWDGCHKIYLVENMAGIRFVQDYVLYPIDSLAEAWDESCPLRFISPADLTGPNYVDQGEMKVLIEYVCRNCQQEYESEPQNTTE